MLALHDAELKAVVDNPPDFDALKIAKSNLVEANNDSCLNGRDHQKPNIESIEDLLIECDLEVYIQLFKGKLTVRDVCQFNFGSTPTHHFSR